MKVIQLLAILMAPILIEAAPVSYSLSRGNSNPLFSFVTQDYLTNIGPLRFEIDADAFTSCNFNVPLPCYKVFIYPTPSGNLGFDLAVYTGVQNNSNSAGFYTFPGEQLEGVDKTYYGYLIGSSIPALLTVYATPEPGAFTLEGLALCFLIGLRYLRVRYINLSPTITA